MAKGKGKTTAFEKTQRSRDLSLSYYLKKQAPGLKAKALKLESYYFDRSRNIKSTSSF